MTGQPGPGQDDNNRDEGEDKGTMAPAQPCPHYSKQLLAWGVVGANGDDNSRRGTQMTNNGDNSDQQG
jgi:hypothetical protein